MMKSDDEPRQMKSSSRKSWLPIAALAAALVIWAGLFAAGAYLNLGADRPLHDLRKPLIILGCMAGFLTVWGAALWLRARRMRSATNSSKTAAMQQRRASNGGGREYRIKFPGYMERCEGFTIPEGGVFYAFYVDEDLVRFDIHTDTAVLIDEEWHVDEKQSTITIGTRQLPFLGVWGGNPLLKRNEIGKLSLANSQVELSMPGGGIKSWQFDNFSEDWEHVTFDRTSNGFLFGAPYDFDFRYIELN
jgi:predicted AlkP superfamily pyrophosphatase or phosphodiesterase